jgi:hypothetical protein
LCSADPKCKALRYFVSANGYGIHHCYFFDNDVDMGPVAYKGHWSYRRAAVWPSFPDAAHLAADPWGNYYKAVYGTIPTVGFPINVIDNWVLHDSTLVFQKVKDVPVPTANGCPTANAPPGQRYYFNDIYSPTTVSWLWHSYPYAALASNTWAEVIHQADPFGDEHFGLWFLYAPGSGIYFNIGITMPFSDHDDAYKHFAAGAVHPNEDMAKAAASAGLDSIQFLSHVDPVQYPCDTKHTGIAGFDYMGMEIVATKLAGTYPCGAKLGAPDIIKAGWQATRICTCDNSLKFLNCQGVPQLVQEINGGSSIFT